MPILDDVKVLQGITDTSKDAMLTILMNRAITVVLNYLNVASYEATYIEETFADAIIELVCYSYDFKGKENIVSESQGSRSVTYANSATFTITQSVKNLLPLPSIRMMG